ncbi:MAG: hypothetical protein FJ290_06685 [Planctomycetes bacterium]|nr:hypothetical protein [Planctomycetota bacterium]
MAAGIPREKPLDEATVLRGNPKVDPKVVRASEELEREVERLGGATQPSYRLRPPLGGILQPAFQSATPRRR